ncbi:DUF3667 domain-containing protein [Aquimarina pacifica]|uniref:DUF3667 domain-containing protein n=1 Tax=Aquimarina pacifica TaxID=1296415 RepID=UPI00046F1138|nr:DUF3667 domain-containing protein [Aquimarina pacifica]
MASTDQCKNCEESFDVSFDYCPHCGQETADNLTFGVLFRNTISNYFCIDARFFKSFIPLMIKPGILAKRFVDGKRLLYLHPAQFYLFISVVFFFIFSFTVRKADNAVSNALKQSLNKEMSLGSLPQIDSVGVETVKKALKKSQVHSRMSDEEISTIDSVITSTQKIPATSLRLQTKVLDSLIINGASQAQKLRAMGKKEDASVFITKIYVQLLKVYEQKGGGIINTLYDTIPITMFFMLPLFALLLKLFYGTRKMFAHHLVFSFYFFTFLFTTFCILILANTFVDLPIWFEVLVFLSFIIYLTLALRTFYQSHWLSAFFKANFISFIYMLIVLPLAMVGVIFVSFMLY